MLLASLPEMHLIVAGHDHGGMKTLLRDGNRMVVRTRPNGAELGKVNLRFDVAANRVVELDWERIPINAAEIEADPTVAKAVAQWESKGSAGVDREIGGSRTAYTRFQMKDVVERAMTESLGVDFAFVNRGAVRAGLVVGKIRARDIGMRCLGNRVVSERSRERIPRRFENDSRRSNSNLHRGYDRLRGGKSAGNRDGRPEFPSPARSCARW